MKNERLRTMVKLAMLVALLAIFCFTPLGFLKIGIVEITFNMIPVIIGAIAVGPAAGAVLGALFGAASFWQCFGQSTFGTLLFGVNPFYTALICFVPRILAGLLPGLIFRAMTKKETISPHISFPRLSARSQTPSFSSAASACSSGTQCSAWRAIRDFPLSLS